MRSAGDRDGASDRILIFVFLGPIVGWAGFFLSIILPAILPLSEGPLTLQVVGDLAAALGLLLALTVPGAYVLGFLPAWLTGLAFERLAGLPPALRVGLCVLLGSGLSALVLAVSPLGAVLGAAAALVCSLFALRTMRAEKSPAPGERG